MKFDKMWNTPPADGYEYIYRYYDVNGRSYIGHTKQSLRKRAGGKNGANYTKRDSAFQRAILEKGFSSFEYDILEIVSKETVDEREKYYIKKYNSKREGYNSTYGGKAYPAKIIDFRMDLNQYSDQQLDSLLHNIILLSDFLHINRGELVDKYDIDFAFKCLEKSFYFIECEYYILGKECRATCAPLVFVCNYLNLLAEEKRTSDQEIYSAICNRMQEFMNFGDDLFSGGYNSLSLILKNGECLTFSVSIGLSR